MVELHTSTSFKQPKSPILDASFSVEDEVTKTQEPFGEMKHPLDKLNDVFDGLHDRTTQMASLAGPVGTNLEIADLRQRLSDQDQKHKNVITEIHGILDELELLQRQYVANVKKEVEREITEKMDKLIQERVAECLKTYIPQELQVEVARSDREPPQHRLHPGSQLLPHSGLPMSPRNPPSALQGLSTPTLSHTITSPVRPPHPSAIAHSSKSLSLMSPPPSSSTLSISNVNRVDVGSLVPQTAAKLTTKKADGTEVSLEILTKSTPSSTTPAVSSSQTFKLELKQRKREIKQLRKERKKAEALELQRLEEEDRILKLKQEEERMLNAKQEEEEALRLTQGRAREEQLSKLAAEVEGHKCDGKQDGQLEDGRDDVDDETSMSMDHGMDKPKDGHRINSSSIISPTSNKRGSRPLDLTSAKRSTSRFVAPLATASFIADIATVPYPEGYHSPHPKLNQNVENGKFKYDREFLLQFMSVCKEWPATRPPLDAIGLKPVHHTFGISRSGPGLG